MLKLYDKCQTCSGAGIKLDTQGDPAYDCPHCKRGYVIIGYLDADLMDKLNDIENKLDDALELIADENN